jgi:hypothetical protein
MFAPISTRSLAQAKRRLAAVAVRSVHFVALAGLLAIVASCGRLPSAPFTGRDPADPAAPVPHAPYRTAIGSFDGGRPVEVKSWREQGEQRSPGDKP